MARHRWTDLEAVGLQGGLDIMGITSADPLAETREVLEQRKAEGLAGSMQFTYRNPARSTEPDRALPGARSMLVGAVSYHRDQPEPPTSAGPVAQVARYVWADDQQRLLSGLQAVADVLIEGGSRACVLSDQNHLVDRAVAHRAGLGWFGKNANLLLPGRGSWFLLGQVVTDAEVIGTPPAATVDDGCGTCDRCIPACPTGAIVAPGTIDARLCLSWLLQATGDFPAEHREALGGRLYGCDDCQEVCPPNRVELRRAAPGGRGGPVPVGRQDQAWVPILALLASTDEQLMSRYGRWYIAERNPRYIRRNALVVLGNVADGSDPQVRAALAAALGDPDDLLVRHAVWAARRLGCDDLLVDIAQSTDPLIRDELSATVNARDAS